MARLFALGVALALAMSATAASRHDERPSLEALKANGGCGPYYYRGVGGNCVQGDGSKWYKPDPYWSPCDYSAPKSIPEGCGGD
jgi:hypothetical protein